MIANILIDWVFPIGGGVILAIVVMEIHDIHNVLVSKGKSRG